MKIDEKEFKKALSNLPAKEKDKLVLRLMRKDPVLKQAYYFDLVDTRSAEELREELAEKVVEQIKDICDRSYLHYINQSIRYVSGDITHHVRVTKDKYGEVYLQLLMLTELLMHSQSYYEKDGYQKHKERYILYVLNRTYKVLGLLLKLHPDLHLDFQEQLTLLGNLISQNSELKMYASRSKLEITWLIDFEIPNDITAIYAQVKKQNLL